MRSRPSPALTIALLALLLPAAARAAEGWDATRWGMTPA